MAEPLCWAKHQNGAFGVYERGGFSPARQRAANRMSHGRMGMTQGSGRPDPCTLVAWRPLLTPPCKAVPTDSIQPHTAGSRLVEVVRIVSCSPAQALRAGHGHCQRRTAAEGNPHDRG